MIFHDFWKFTKFNNPSKTGRSPQMIREVFPSRKRAFPRRCEMFEQYFQHFPGFGGRYRVVETTRSHQNDENVENWWKSWIFKIFRDFMKLTDPITAGGPPQMVREVFPVRKRAFPKCLKKFGKYFQHFSGFAARYRVVEVHRSHQNDENQFWKMHDFQQFPIFSSFRRLLVVSTTLYRPQNLKNVENSFQTFWNASETHSSERKKLPWPSGVAHPEWSGQSISWNHRKSWKSMLFINFQNFINFQHFHQFGDS